jgi:hypothetical protein
MFEKRILPKQRPAFETICYNQWRLSGRSTHVGAVSYVFTVRPVPFLINPPPCLFDIPLFVDSIYRLSLYQLSPIFPSLPCFNVLSRKGQDTSISSIDNDA